MYLTDYCSEYVRNIYSIGGSFNGKHIGSYLYSIDNEDEIASISKFLRDIKPSNKSLELDGGFVFEFEYKECEGYVVVQDIYSFAKDNKLSNTLSLVTEYVKELEDKGIKEVMMVDSYSEYNNNLHSFGVSFIVDKEEIDER